MPPAAQLKDIYLACAPAAFRRARSILGSEDEAWDIVQKVFLKLAQRDLISRVAVRPMTYVYRATTNACLNELEARRVRERAGDSTESASSALDESLHARDLLAKLDSKLDEMDRQILVLAFHDGLAQESIAQVLGVWRRTVGRRLARLRLLAAELESAPLRRSS